MENTAQAGAQSQSSGFDQDSFLFMSAKNSSNFEIFQTSIKNGHPDQAVTLVKEKQNEILGTFQLTTDGIYFTSTQNGVDCKLYVLKGGIESEIQLPTISGYITISTKGPDYPDVWISTMGWLNDLIRYKYNKYRFEEENLSDKAKYPEFDHFIIKELLVPSHDGTEVPLSIIHKKDIQLNGQHPTLLSGYGAYGISYSPRFSPSILTWVEEGGILCFAHVRGGGEKGDQWYQAGKKTTKPNTWKDLIACTEYMIHQGYTSKRKTAIYSGSAGGILVGRAMTERPDLFAVVISRVGVMNALRQEEMPSGPSNAKEFGTSKDPIECKALIEMDAYLHIKKDTKYPATLITAGMNDPRVAAWQPGKFAAKLQRLNCSNKPIIFKVDYESGHGKNNTKSKNLEQWANIFSFALWQTGQVKYRLSTE